MIAKQNEGSQETGLVHFHSVFRPLFPPLAFLFPPLAFLFPPLAFLFPPLSF